MSADDQGAPGERRPITSPLDGRVLGSVPVNGPEDVRSAIARARTAGRAWAGWPVARRARVAARFRDLVLDHSAELIDLVHAENGKSRINAFEEVLDTALTAGYYAQNAARFLAPSSRVGAIPLVTSASVHYRPKGVVGIISPWNYPLTLAVSDAVPALLAGNAVVLKPDSKTPLTALRAVDWLRQAGLPQDLMAVVTGPGNVLGSPLIDGVDHLMFTGSTATGRRVAAQCGERLIECTAELGGKNALLVLADADVGRTVEGAIQACFSTTGQLCVSIERIYVHASLFDEFCAAFAARSSRIVLGAGDGWDVDLGPLIDAGQLEKVSRHVDDAVARGATVLAGGRARPDLGPTFYEPTVLTGVTDEMILARAETFGPVVAVYAVASDQAAIAAANDTPYGLNASVWSRSPRHARAVARQLATGTVNINEGYAAAWGSHGAPMGGAGISGLGRRHGRDGILKYTEPQTIAAQRGGLIGPPRGVRRETYAAVMTRAARLLHRLPLSLP
jgi:succinate-semialdehyde dehydrogenase/glutarate-semialdehyde dehydrogenase